MKSELSPLERAYLANLLRRRAMEVQHSADSTIEERQRAELNEESTFAESLAIRLDEGEALTVERTSVPRQVDPRRDLDYVDQPT